MTEYNLALIFTFHSINSLALSIQEIELTEIV